LRIVQAASEGVVKSIEVKENQVVRKGDATIIDDSQLPKKEPTARKYPAEPLQLAQIDAQINSLDTRLPLRLD